MIQTQMKLSKGALVCELEGSFVASSEVNQVKEAIWRSCTDGNLNLILDFHRVDRIDSFGLGLLTVILGRLKAMNRQCVISRPGEMLKQTLQFTRLDTLIPALDSIPEAEKFIREREKELAEGGSQEPALPKQSPSPAKASGPVADDAGDENE